MSKDFSLAGERVGFYYGENVEILSAVQEYAEEHSVPSSVQRWTTELLSDTDFIDNFLLKSKSMLTSLYDELSKGLDDLKIPFVRCSYGLYVWADFREFLPSGKQDSYEGERELWKHLIEKVGVLFTPGEACGGEPGHFRICFAFGQDISNVRVTITRLKKFVA